MPPGQRIIPIHHRKLCKILEMDGCSFIRQEGSHMKYRKEQTDGRTLTITVPRYRSIPVGVIISILHQSRMSRERYFELMKEA